MFAQAFAAFAHTAFGGLCGVLHMAIQRRAIPAGRLG